jgi:hypothetical protein
MKILVTVGGEYFEAPYIIDVGNAPANLKLATGKHTIRVSQPDYKDWSREVTVQAGAA